MILPCPGKTPFRVGRPVTFPSAGTFGPDVISGGTDPVLLKTSLQYNERLIWTRTLCRYKSVVERHVQ